MEVVNFTLAISERGGRERYMEEVADGLNAPIYCINNRRHDDDGT